jgi:hypothetical protein
MTKDKRSPPKAKPLRNPGQSLDEQIHDLISDYALGPLVFALFLGFITALEWLKYYQSLPPAPFLYSFVALVAVGSAVFRFFRVRREFKSLRLAETEKRLLVNSWTAFANVAIECFMTLSAMGLTLIMC